jgi:hypothetical protein
MIYVKSFVQLLLWNFIVPVTLRSLLCEHFEISKIEMGLTDCGESSASGFISSIL